MAEATIPQIADVLNAAKSSLVASAAKAPTPGKVTVVFPKDSDSAIVPYKNGTHGYIQLTSQVIVMDKQWPRLKKRSMLYKAELPVLEHIMKNEVSRKDMSLPGQLVIKEFVYDDDFLDPTNEVAAPYAGQLNMDEDDEETRLKTYLKRDGGDDATILRVGEDPILRFTEYDHSRSENDILVAYDNFDEVRTARLERKK